MCCFAHTVFSLLFNETLNPGRASLKPSRGKTKYIYICVCEKYQKSENWGKRRIYSPLTPDQPPLKGGRYVTRPLSGTVPALTKDET